MYRFLSVLWIVALLAGCATTTPVQTKKETKEKTPDTFTFAMKALANGNFVDSYKGFVEACKEGVIGACREEGRFYMTRDRFDGVDTDDAKATKLFQQSCLKGDNDACFYLGLQTKHGRGVEQNDAKAESLFKNACIRGQKEACKYTKDPVVKANSKIIVPDDD